jgi:dTDP-4-dehydrorhamnose reductase/UDP-glucose 4-epimerase
VTTVVVGAGSMIARALRRHPDAAGWLYLPHQQALTESGWVRDARVVINLAFDPRLKTAAYDPALDVDRRLAAILAPSSCAYIMVSTRMAYGPPGDGLRLAETMPSNPVNYYGTAKLAAERHLLAAQGDRVTVLRLSNIFDPSEAAGERRSFFGMAMRTLAAQGRIIYDMSPFVARDFLPADLLAERLVAVAAHPRPGMFNLGAGFAIRTGRIAQWLIGGYGAGELLVTDFREHDGFWLDMTRSMRTWNFPPVTEPMLRDACIAAGAQLARGDP